MRCWNLAAWRQCRHGPIIQFGAYSAAYRLFSINLLCVFGDGGLCPRARHQRGGAAPGAFAQLWPRPGAHCTVDACKEPQRVRARPRRRHRRHPTSPALHLTGCRAASAFQTFSRVGLEEASPDHPAQCAGGYTVRWGVWARKIIRFADRAQGSR
jgi:hypothetical protein